MIRGNYYGIVTIKKTADYTKLCVDSFFKNTKLKENDKFIVIDNDGYWSEINPNAEYEIIINDVSKNFSKNYNTLFKLSKDNGLNAVLITNDVVLTPNWSDRLLDDETLSIPSCNQTHQHGIPESTSIEEFNNRYGMLNAIAYRHHTFNKIPFERIMMPMYCCKVPYNIIDKVGYFDENYNMGGEDVDYRIRTLQAGFDVKYCSAFTLHFNGRSSWNGLETAEETKKRNEMYLDYFLNKWGQDLFDLCIITGNSMRVVEKYRLHNHIKEQRFNDMMLEVLKNT
jgi:GT2 family glycosyltransferase